MSETDLDDDQPQRRDGSSATVAEESGIPLAYYSREGSREDDQSVPLTLPSRRISVELIFRSFRLDAEEKTCYVALSPAKEEKEAQGGARGEEFRLPDGNVIRVRRFPPNHDPASLKESDSLAFFKLAGT